MSLFTLDVVVLFIMLVGATWSVAVPSRRIWPPPGKRSWQYYATWLGFFLVFPLNAALLFLDWNAWIFDGASRFVTGVPLATVGTLLVSWGIGTLGVRNTSGLRFGFISSGPYRFTRNPQCVGDMFLFVGLSVVANSSYLWITHVLLILVFMIIPLADELWLEEEYGAEYLSYEQNAPRFL